MIIYTICFLVSLVIFTFYKKIFSWISIFDHPDNDRKVHKRPIYLSGSLFLICNVVIFLFYVFFFSENDYLNLFIKKRDFFFYLITLLGFYSLGVLDDKYDISPWTKLGTTSFLLILLLLSDDNLIINFLLFEFSDFSVRINLEELAIFFTLIFFLGYLNSINMFDGINLQLGVYSTFVSAFLIYNSIFVELNIILIISLVPFLILNGKNKVFIGNSGTLIISFIYGYQYLKAYNFGYLGIDSIILLNYLISLDLIRVFVIRIKNGYNPFVADQNHIHHLLSKKIKYNYVILITLSLSCFPAILSIFYANKWALLLIFSAIYLFIIFYFMQLLKKSS